MTIIARPATPGLWEDFSVWPSDAHLAAFKASGGVGCLVYGPLPGVSDAQKSNDLTPARLQQLTGMGLDVLLVQHCRYPNWDPREHSGTDDAAAIGAHALWCGYPTAAHVYNDWEGVNRQCPADAGATFLESWAVRLAAYPYGQALYVGYQQPLSAAQLYALHRINTYASDEGHRRVATRGVAFSQGPQVLRNGAIVDLDQLQPDLLGEVPWAAADDSAPAAA